MTYDRIMTEYTIVVSSMRNPIVQENSRLYAIYETEERKLRKQLRAFEPKEVA